MENHPNPARQKLFRALMQLRKIEWHQRSIAGCKPSEIRILFCIRECSSFSDSPSMKVSEISKHLKVTAPTITQLLKGLEARGLIERHIDPIDRRAVAIKLTEKGEMVTDQAGAAFMESLQGLIEYLGEEQSNQLADLLGKVFLHFQEKAVTSQTQWSGDEDL